MRTPNQGLLVCLRDGGYGVGTPASPAVRGHGSSLPRLPPWRQMATSRQPLAVTERWSRPQSCPCCGCVTRDFFQTPPDLVVKFQPIDIVDVILWLVLRQRVM